MCRVRIPVCNFNKCRKTCACMKMAGEQKSEMLKLQKTTYKQTNKIVVFCRATFLRLFKLLLAFVKVGIGMNA